MFKHFYLKFSNDLKSKITIVEDFEPTYTNSGLFSIKYDNKYYVSAEKPPRYCDLNVIYVTTNFNYYQKYRDIFDFRFLPYLVYFKKPITKELVELKQNKTNILEFNSFDTHLTGKHMRLPYYKELNNIDINMCCNELHINVLNDTLPIDKYLYCMAFANNIIIHDQILPETSNIDLLVDLCNWLDCKFDIKEQIINTSSIDVNKYNKLLKINETYVLDYILNVNKTIDQNITYSDFLTSNIW